MELSKLLALYSVLSKQGIIVAYRGSIAHGTYLPGTDPHSVDDRDLMAVIIPGRSYYHGLTAFGNRDTLDFKQDEWDVVAYEIRKFVRLLMAGNPNVLALLWLTPDLYVHLKPVGRRLIEHRDLFVGRHVYHAFVGYANSQLKKMTAGAFNGYMGERRKALVAEFGFDAKNASHLIRLLRMGKEFMQTGDLRVNRSRIDAEELLAIKHGRWTLQRVKDLADYEFAEARAAYEHSQLPENVDLIAIEHLLVELIEEELGD